MSAPTVAVWHFNERHPFPQPETERVYLITWAEWRRKWEEFHSHRVDMVELWWRAQAYVTDYGWPCWDWKENFLERREP